MLELEILSQQASNGNHIQRHSNEMKSIRKVGAMILRILRTASTKSTSRSLIFVNRSFVGLVGKENIDRILRQPEVLVASLP